MTRVSAVSGRHTPTPVEVEEGPMNSSVCSICVGSYIYSHCH